ncbi:MAG: TlpA family protein disulfide reductase [Planctomycetaceae bacterium]|nr:TlpA family protein disulfide reductase [Planctomycetaceae bacterium]
MRIKFYLSPFYLFPSSNFQDYNLLRFCVCPISNAAVLNSPLRKQQSPTPQLRNILIAIVIFALCVTFNNFTSICFAQTRIIDEQKLTEIRDIITRHTQSEIFKQLGDKPVPKKIINDSTIVIKATSLLLEPDVLEKNDPEHKIIPSKSWLLKRRTLALVYLSYDDEKVEEFFPALVNEITNLEAYEDCSQMMRFAEEHTLRIASLLIIRNDKKIKIDPASLTQWYVDHVERYPGRNSEQLIIRFLDMVKELNGNSTSDKILSACAAPFAKVLLNSQDEKITARGKKLEAVARWYDLPGNEMQLKGTDINGAVFDIATLKGKVVLVEFWGTWCIACVKDFPMLAGYYEDFKKSGFEIVGVNTGTKNDAELYVKNFVKNTKFAENKTITWQIVLDGLKQNTKDRITTYYGIETLPQSVLIGMDGKVITLNPPKDSLREQIQKALTPPIDPEKLTPEQRKLWEQKQQNDAAELEETKRFSETIKLQEDK